MIKIINCKNYKQYESLDIKKHAVGLKYRDIDNVFWPIARKTEHGWTQGGISIDNSTNELLIDEIASGQLEIKVKGEFVGSDAE
jgi:hypothetical protein